MKKCILSLLLSVLLLCTLLPSAAFAAGSELEEVWLSDDATTGGTGTREKPFNNAVTALQNVKSGGTIYTTGFATFSYDNMENSCITIPRSITIKGVDNAAGKSHLTLRGGLDLLGDLTISNVTLAMTLASATERIIYANGHDFTLTKNVTLSGGTVGRGFFYYAGGYNADVTLRPDTSQKLTLAAGLVSGIYARGKDEAKTTTGNLDITLSDNVQFSNSLDEKGDGIYAGGRTGDVSISVSVSNAAFQVPKFIGGATGTDTLTLTNYGFAGRDIIATDFERLNLRGTKASSGSNLTGTKSISLDSSSELELKGPMTIDAWDGGGGTLNLSGTGISTASLTVTGTLSGTTKLKTVHRDTPGVAATTVASGAKVELAGTSSGAALEEKTEGGKTTWQVKSYVQILTSATRGLVVPEGTDEESTIVMRDGLAYITGHSNTPYVSIDAFDQYGNPIYKGLTCTFTRKATSSEKFGAALETHSGGGRKFELGTYMADIDAPSKLALPAGWITVGSSVTDGGVAISLDDQTVYFVIRPVMEIETEPATATVTMKLSGEAGLQGTAAFYDETGASHGTVAVENNQAKRQLIALAPGKHTITMTYTPKDGMLYRPASGMVEITIPDIPPQNLAWVGADKLTTTYGETNVAGLIAENETVGGGGITYQSGNPAIASVDSGTGVITPVAAGSCNITATAAAVSGYQKTSITYLLTVEKKVPTVDDFTITTPVAPIIFDGSEKHATATTKVGISGMGAVTVLYGSTTTAPIAAGTYPLTLNVADGTNYLPQSGLSAGMLTIDKAAAPTVSNVTKELVYSKAHDNVKVDITGLPTDCDTTAFVVGSPTGTTSILSGAAKATSSGIQFSTAVGTMDSTAAIPVTVTMKNYGDAHLNVNIKLVNKTEVTITGVSALGKTYDGKALPYSGTPKNEQGYVGDYDYIWTTADGTVPTDGSAPKDAGTYTLTIKIPETDADYMGEQVIKDLAIAPTPLTVKPQALSIESGAALPTAFQLEYTGLLAGEKADVTGVPAFALQKKDGSLLQDSSTQGSYAIKWTNSADATITNKNYTLTAGDGTLTITAKSGGGDGGGGGGGAAQPPVTSPETEVKGSTATVPADAKTSGGKTTAAVTDAAIKAAIEAAQKAATERGTPPTLEIKVETPAGAGALAVAIPKSALDRVSDSKLDSVTITSGIGTLVMGKDAAAALARQAGSKGVTVSILLVDKPESLNQKQQAAVAETPVYEVTLQSGDKHITVFDSASITISLPYTLKAGEVAEGVAVWYVDDAGKLERVSAAYHTGTGMATFVTKHLSLYAVGYDAAAVWQNPFTDVATGAYYYDAVRWASQSKVTQGTSATAFSPELACTRAQVVALLWNAMGRPAPTAAAQPFTDVSADSYYADAVRWAVEQGITSSTTKTTFSPDTVVTRAQFATFLWRSAKSPAPGEKNPFTDVTDAHAYYRDAVLWAYGAKVTKGTTDTTFSPHAPCTRAQVVTFLFQYMG